MQATVTVPDCYPDKPCLFELKLSAPQPKGADSKKKSESLSQFADGTPTEQVLKSITTEI